MAEFFGFGGYRRAPEGYFSWQHLTFVTTLLVVALGLAVVLGIVNRRRSEREKNRVLTVTAILIDVLEIAKIVLLYARSGDPRTFLLNLPLFLCSIMLIAIPLAAFSRGRLRESSLDFVFIFGMLAAVIGTYCAGQNYSVYPVLSLDNVASGLTHSISGFASLYVAVSGMISMKRRNVPITFMILCGFCAAAYVADVTIPYNYMFLMKGDGTPYDLVYSFVGGNPVLYPLLVVVLFLLWITAFYLVFYLIKERKKKE